MLWFTDFLEIYCPQHPGTEQNKDKDKKSLTIKKSKDKEKQKQKICIAMQI